VQVGNPYDEATRVWIIAEQTNPLFRTYVETNWLWLKPKQTRTVRVMLEYALDPKSDRLPADLDKRLHRQIEKLSQVPNTLGLHAYAENPADNPRHALELLGGAGIQVTTGRATTFAELGYDNKALFGRIVTSDDGMPVSGGSVVVTLTPDKKKPAAFVQTGVRVEANGEFVAQLGEKEFRFLRADYLPAMGYGACQHDWIKAR
jgi:hypothetical protein